MFCGFTLVSGQAALRGQTSCNCFRPVSVHPWWVCGFDAALVALLCVARPSTKQFKADVSGSSGCSCLVSEVHVTLPAGEARAVRVTLKVAEDFRGRMYRSIELWTDLPRQTRLRVAVGFDSSNSG